MSTPNTPEPAPRQSAGVNVWDLVFKDMMERDLVGFKKYQTRLKLNNGRDMLIDAYQEILDLAVYLRGEIEEKSLRRERMVRMFEFQCKDGHGLTHTQQQEILSVLD